MRVNYKNSGYKFRFGKDPKEWSIEQLHQLYLDAYSRASKKNKIVLGIIQRISDELPDAGVYSNRKTRILFKEKGDKVYKRVLSYQDEWGSWGIGSWEELKFTGTISDIREEKLNLLLSCQKQFELGALYDKYNRDNLYLYRIPWEALCEKVIDKLREKFDKKTAPEYFTITIGDRDYIVHCGDDSRYNRFYKSFSLKNESKHIDL